MRWRTVLLTVVLVSAAVYSVTTADRELVEGPDAPASERLVSPDGTSSYVWPYTSRSRSVEGRTLPLNVILLGDTDRVRRALAARADANWSSVDPNATVSLSPWRPAHGSIRYTYVTPDRNVTGQWIPSDYQLHVGTYFGRRTHARAYSSHSGDWTALQAHTEYWDWFRVRHTVTGVDSGARFVERDMRDEPFVEGVTRITYESRSGDSESWWTVVDLVPGIVLVGAAAQLTKRWSRRDVALSVGLAGIVLGVRGWGLAAEALFPGVTPKLFVAIGYPVLAAGPPVLAAVLARDRPTNRILPLAVAGFGAGIALDLAFVGVRQVPTHLAAHRVALVATIGLLALGAAREDRRVVAFGVAAWAVLLAAPLVGVV